MVAAGPGPTPEPIAVAAPRRCTKLPVAVSSQTLKGFSGPIRKEGGLELENGDATGTGFPEAREQISSDRV